MIEDVEVFRFNAGDRVPDWIARVEGGCGPSEATFLRDTRVERRADGTVTANVLPTINGRFCFAADSVASAVAGTRHNEGADWLSQGAL